VEAVLQVPGGGGSGQYVCAFHADEYHPQNDVPLNVQSDRIVPEHPQPGGTRTSFTDSLSITTPTVTTTVPSSTTAAAFLAAPNLTVNGTGFSASWPTTQVRFAGTPVATTFVSSVQVTAVVPAGLIAAGSFAIDVVNLGPPYQSSDTAGLSPDADSRNTVNESNDATLVLS